MTYLYALFAFVAGTVLPIQVGVNNSLRNGIGGPVLAALISFVVGSICLLVFAIFTRTP